ncbi:gamma-butyrobetaine dioxygenase [Paracoccidioides lutzii Pb01]|uniref:Gamma-butyrobetaine dioxygenase n=1 Tax=Paracoccidioides lutzii (strain ATCC MYA-826 / Pb01) TaxID=502779 RepID=C1GT04_PARBA|nr:gamma-butyrobetaine dioxygenase [Paracoccidioides lutzii Pb01]EEH39187.2 gamma-butyrobetaine dioxygenase [Paracoccidioides lutzii Pb01]
MSLGLLPLHQVRFRLASTYGFWTALRTQGPSISLLRAGYSDAAQNKYPIKLMSHHKNSRTFPTELRSFIVKNMESAEVGSLGWVTVKLGNNAYYIYSGIRLRDACTCAKCVDSSTKQRDFRMSDIPVDIKARTAEVQNGKLVVTWINDIAGYDESHISTYSADQLTALSAGEKYFRAKIRKRTSWDKSLIEKHQHWVSFKDYMEDETKFALAMRSLNEFGIMFVKDIPESAEMVEKIATRMGPLRNSFYGETWDVRSVPDAKNVAYTNKRLDFHMDLLYMKDPPGYQLLHCLRNSFSGGESLFSDTLQAAINLLNNYPYYFDTLCNVPTRFEYKNNNQHYEYSHRTIEIDGEREWLTSSSGATLRAYINRVNYSPPFQAPSYLSEYLKEHRDVQKYIKAMHAFATEISKPENILQVKLEPGQCVIFQNRRVVHARNAFDLSSASDGKSSDERWLRGAYVDEDALRSKLRIISEQFPEISTKRIVPRPGEVLPNEEVANEDNQT